MKLLPVTILIEKVPFLEYLIRLLSYLRNPSIDASAIDKNVLRFALADVFLAFGFVVTVTASLAIFVERYGYLAFAGALNPNVVLLTYILYASTFAVTFTMLSVLGLAFSKRRGDLSLKIPAYLLLLHCARFYAFCVVVNYAAFVHLAGLVIDGTNLTDHFAKHCIAYLILILIVIGLVFHLFVNPVWRYTAIPKNPILGQIMWCVVMVIALIANFAWPVFPKNAVIDTGRCIELVRGTSFYRTFPEHNRTKIEERLCR